MSDPYVGQITVVAFNFAPRGWAFCQGQILPISQNTALFSLLGTTYGGDGKSNFALPNLQGCMALGTGQGAGLPNVFLGETGGEPNVTLLINQIPVHTHHQAATSAVATQNTPRSNMFGSGGRQGPLSYYTGPPGPSQLALMNAQAILPAGSNQPHPNMMPYLTLNYIIALTGVFPPRP